MRTTVIWVVQGECVPLPHGVRRKLFDQPAYGRDESTQMYWNRCRLAEGLTVRKEQGSRGVPALFDYARIGTPEEGELHLVSDGLKATFHNLKLN